MADEEEFDQYELADGLGLDNVDADVQAAEFTINNGLGHSNLCLALTLVPRNGEETKVQYFSMGPGWVAKEDGRKAVSENGQMKRISKQCTFGVLLKSMEVAIGGRDGMRGLGNPLVNTTWIGTAWHLKRESRMTTNPETKVEKESSVVLATAYLGKKASGSAPATPSATPSAAATLAPANGSSNGGGGMDAAILAKLTELAKGAASEDKFLEAAALLEEVRGDRLVQKALYADGFHAQLVKA